MNYENCSISAITLRILLKKNKEINTKVSLDIDIALQVPYIVVFSFFIRIQCRVLHSFDSRG